MVWWGLNGTNILEPEQLELCRERGFAAYTVDSIRRRGVQQTIREALEIASQGVDHVYVTFDIDATDGAFAPGTHSIVLDGLTAGEVLEALGVVAEHELLGAFDVCEMIPQYDVGGGRTARYAAHAILAVIGRRVLDSRPAFDQADARRRVPLVGSDSPARCSVGWERFAATLNYSADRACGS